MTNSSGAPDAPFLSKAAPYDPATFAQPMERAERLDLDALTHLVLALARTVAASRRDDYAMALAIQRSIILSWVEYEASDGQLAILALFEQLCDAVMN